MSGSRGRERAPAGVFAPPASGVDERVGGGKAGDGDDGGARLTEKRWSLAVWGKSVDYCLSRIGCSCFFFFFFRCAGPARAGWPEGGKGSDEGGVYILGTWLIISMATVPSSICFGLSVSMLDLARPKGGQK